MYTVCVNISDPFQCHLKAVESKTRTYGQLTQSLFPKRLDATKQNHLFTAFSIILFITFMNISKYHHEMSPHHQVVLICAAFWPPSDWEFL